MLRYIPYHMHVQVCDMYALLTSRQTAALELDNFSRILEMEGVTVRRPEVRPGDFNRPVSTPDFESKSQLYAAMPRDILIVVSVFVLSCITFSVGCARNLVACAYYTATRYCKTK